MDQELLIEMRSCLEGLRTVTEFDQAQSIEIVDRIASVFVSDRTRLWWWESLAVEFLQINYGDSDGLAILSEGIENSDSVYLIVTDDENGPWPVFHGAPSDILSLIYAQRFFEYILSDFELRWAVFDTHHNCLYVVGDLAHKLQANT